MLDLFWKELKVPHLDLLPVYAGCSSKALTVNAHDAHPNELANAMAADTILHTLGPAFTNHVQNGKEPIAKGN
jgi:hypothetical protein